MLDRAYSGSLIALIVSPCRPPDTSDSFQNVWTWHYSSGEYQVVSVVVIGSLGHKHAFLVCLPGPLMTDFSTTVYKAAEEEILKVIHEWESVCLYTQAIGNYVQRFLKVEVHSLSCTPFPGLADLVSRVISMALPTSLADLSAFCSSYGPFVRVCTATSVLSLRRIGLHSSPGSWMICPSILLTTLLPIVSC